MAGGFRTVTIDGVDVTGNVDVGRGLTIEFSVDETTGAVTFAVSSELLFTGNAYDQLKKKFFDNCIDCTEKADLFIEFDCCDFSLDFEIEPGSLQFDPINCTVSVAGIEKNEDLEGFKYLNTNVWWLDDQGTRIWEEQPAYNIYYLVEPNFWQRIWGFFTNVFGNGFAEDKRQFFHPSLKLYTILLWNAQRAGLNFVSETIFEPFYEYRNIAIIPCSNRGGHRGNDYDGTPIETNYPVQTTFELLSALGEVFNGKHRVQNGNLRFETIEYWNTNVEIVGDLQDLYSQNAIDEEVLFELDTGRNKAYGDFQYANEAQDGASNYALKYFNDIRPWSVPDDNCMKGKFELELSFSVTHIVNDLGWRERLRSEGGSTNEKITDKLTSGEMFMTNGMAQLPKLMILEENTPTYRARPMRRTPLFAGGDLDNLNALETGWQLSFGNDVESLYSRFHRYSASYDGFDPRVWLLANDITFAPEDFCAVVTTVQSSGLQIGITTPYGTAIPTDGVEINFTEKTVTLRKLQVRCTPS